MYRLFVPFAAVMVVANAAASPPEVKVAYSETLDSDCSTMHRAEIKEPWKPDLVEVIKIDGELPGGYYKRAWEIVNQTDGTYLKYMSELRGKTAERAP